MPTIRATIHMDMGEDLKPLGGILRCDKCRKEQDLGNVGHNLKDGWPECCGYTMTWVTQRQLDEEKNKTEMK